MPFTPASGLFLKKKKQQRAANEVSHKVSFLVKTCQQNGNHQRQQMFKIEKRKLKLTCYHTCLMRQGKVKLAPKCLDTFVEHSIKCRVLRCNYDHKSVVKIIKCWYQKKENIIENGSSSGRKSSTESGKCKERES